MDSINSVNITGPNDNWSCGTYQLEDLDNDGIWNGNFIITEGTFTYIYCADNWTYTEGPSLLLEMQNGESCALILIFLIMPTGKLIFLAIQPFQILGGNSMFVHLDVLI